MSFLNSTFLKSQDTKTESLQTQYEYLKLLRRRHQQWMNKAQHPEIEGMHLEIAELLDQITDQYRRLLDALQQQRDTE